MAGFQYFVPNVSKIDFEAIGLTYAFENIGEKRVCPSVGPDGLHGVLASDQRRVETGRDGYRPTQQKWVKTARGYYVGLETANPPKPAELLRRKPLGGVKVELGDDQEWIVPIARRWSADDGPGAQLVYDVVFDQAMELGDDGAMRVGAVLPRYADLWAIANAWLHQVHGVVDDQPTDSAIEQAVLGGPELSQAGAWVLASRVLSANYAVSSIELAMLKVLTKQNWSQVLDALVDAANYLRLRAKKNGDSAGESSSSGPADNSPNTDPPALTS